MVPEVLLMVVLPKAKTERGFAARGRRRHHGFAVGDDAAINTCEGIASRVATASIVLPTLATVWASHR